jgi:hypothetical protein
MIITKAKGIVDSLNIRGFPFENHSFFLLYILIYVMNTSINKKFSKYQSEIKVYVNECK